MVTSEVQRTLVKSPPELWAELSDPAALARHLGDLGDVGNMRIIRVHAEERVDWEADSISGSVLMKASGWGTKVTLRVSRELGEIEPTVAEAPDAPGDEPDAAVEPVATTPEASESRAQEAEELPEAVEVEVEILCEEAPEAQAPAEEEPALEPRRGLFSRLFRRRRPATRPEPVETTAITEKPMSLEENRATPASSPEPLAEEPSSSPEPVAAEPSALEEQGAPPPEVVVDDAPPTEAAEPVVATDTPPEQSVDVSADLKAAEEVAAEEVTAVLTATLDRLGAAHHRPFSRS